MQGDSIFRLRVESEVLKVIIRAMTDEMISVVIIGLEKEKNGGEDTAIEYLRKAVEMRWSI